MRTLLSIFIIALTACKSPLEISGSGDIVERLQGQRGCSIEEFNAGLSNCSDNDVSETEQVLYQGLPRPGWVFSHWEGLCAEVTDCELSYSADWAELWDELYPDVAGPALTAVFVEQNNANPGTYYTASNFGLSGNDTFSALLDALFYTAGSYRYTTQQAGTRSYFNRQPGFYARQPNGVLATGAQVDDYDVGGTAADAMDIITLVDTDSSDGDISVSYLTAKLSEAGNDKLKGTYYCGRVGSGGAASYFRAILNGNGGGVMEIESDRQGYSGQAGVSYAVYPDGTTTFDYAGVHLVGSITADGGVFLASQLQDSARGAASCIRASANKTVLTASGTYNGALFSGKGAVGVTELLAVNSGQTAEAVLVDSYGNRTYSLGSNWLLVNYDGKSSTQDANGAISADGRVMFQVQTNPNQFGSLTVYLKQAN